MAGYQKLTLVGNVGANPETTPTQWGPVTNFDVAVNGKHNPPIWYSVSTWGKLGEAMSQYLTKGREVLIESDRFEPVWWTDQRSGEVVTRINVTASRVVFLDGGAPEKSANPQQDPQQRQQVSQQRQEATPQRQQVSQQRPQASLKLKQVSQQRPQVSQQRQQVSQQQQQQVSQQQQQQVGEYPDIPF